MKTNGVIKYGAEDIISSILSNDWEDRSPETAKADKWQQRTRERWQQQIIRSVEFSQWRVK